MVRVVIGIGEDQEPSHQIIIEVQGQEVNIESCIEEARAWAIDWAKTWLRHPGMEVTIKNRQGRPLVQRPRES